MNDRLSQGVYWGKLGDYFVADYPFISAAQFPGASLPIPSRITTWVWRNKITLPPSFSAAQTRSSSASADPLEDASTKSKQRTSDRIRLVELSWDCGTRSKVRPYHACAQELSSAGSE